MKRASSAERELETATRQVLRDASPGTLMVIAFSPDGSTLAIASALDHSHPQFARSRNALGEFLLELFERIGIAFFKEATQLSGFFVVSIAEAVDPQLGSRCIASSRWMTVHIF